MTAHGWAAAEAAPPGVGRTMDWNIKRWLKHEFTGRRALRKVLPSESMQRLTQATAASEKRHGAQLRLAVECALHFDLLEYGIAQARRGWAKASDIVNTRNVNEMLKLLKRG